MKKFGEKKETHDFVIWLMILALASLFSSLIPHSGHMVLFH